MPVHSKDELTVELVAGVEGKCIYLNGYRIVGPKPWGGGSMLQRWTVTRADVLYALNSMPLPAPKKNPKAAPKKKKKKA